MTAVTIHGLTQSLTCADKLCCRGLAGEVQKLATREGLFRPRAAHAPVHEKAAAVEMNMNNDLVTKVVYCLRDGKVIGGPYRVSYARTLGPTSPPLSERLIAEAKANLSSEGLASPPFEGITFEIRDP